MPTATIIVKYKKTGTRATFKCITANPADAVVIGEVAVLIANDALNGASELKLQIVPESTPWATDAEVVAAQALLMTKLSDGKWTFTAKTQVFLDILNNGGELRLRLKIDSKWYDFAIVLLTMSRSAAFTPFGILEIIKLPPTTSPTGGAGGEPDDISSAPATDDDDDKPAIDRRPGRGPRGTTTGTRRPTRKK